MKVCFDDQRGDSHRPEGFTLVEVLVASGVAAVLLLVVIRAFSVASNLTSKGGQTLYSLREGRAAMQMMIRDLRFIHRPEGGLPMLMIEPPTSSVGAFYALKSTGKREELIGYYCKWQPEKKCYALMRAVLPEADLFLKSGGGSLKAPFTPEEGEPVTLTVFEEQLAAYIWDFMISPCQDGAVVPLTHSESYEEELPSIVEIRFKIIAPNAITQLQALPVTAATWANANDPIYRSVILPNQYEFVARGRILSSRMP